KIAALNALDIYPAEGMVTISRRIMPGKSIIKVNGETITAAGVRKITELLIDIHGQHDHQSLLYTKNHLEILDKYAREEIEPLKEELAGAYEIYTGYKKQLSEFTLSEEERMREKDFLSYEIREIEEADLKIGEDEEAENLFRKITNSKNILSVLDSVVNLTQSEGSTGDMLGKAYSALNSVVRYDEELVPLLEQLSLIDSQLNDFNCDLKKYIDGMEFDEYVYITTETRLNTINSLKSKYGRTIESILRHAEKSSEKLKFYEDYEENLAATEEKLSKAYDKVKHICDKISKVRREAGVKLSKAICTALEDLNFEQVQFDIEVRKLDNPTRNGSDEAEFMISLNPGESPKPLAKIASGGELSRIMLGIKSVLAGRDDIDTLIFDEIDTGISGRTAQKVSEKMAEISKSHQVICITHLPQIAAMADAHFLIQKNIENGFTRTTIKELTDGEMTDELARMLGGKEITDIVRQNAAQMKEMASRFK
ncbi:MAG: DNA repair protein RecN, partial [Butyrivibrio sp.]